MTDRSPRTDLGILPALHEESEALGMLSYTGDGHGGWSPDLTPDDIGKIRGLIGMAGIHIAALEHALGQIVECYHRESEDANDGEFALWKADDLINAIIAGREVLRG